MSAPERATTERDAARTERERVVRFENPDMSGKSFLPIALNEVAWCRLRDVLRYRAIVEVDGGERVTWVRRALEDAAGVLEAAGHEAGKKHDGSYFRDAAVLRALLADLLGGENERRDG